MISEKGKAVKENTVNRKKDQEGQNWRMINKHRKIKTKKNPKTKQTKNLNKQKTHGC